MIGTVERIEHGYAFLIGPDGREYFLHRSELTEGNWFDLQLGATVKFEGTESARGPRATKACLVTDTPQEAA